MSTETLTRPLPEAKPAAWQPCPCGSRCSDCNVANRCLNCWRWLGPAEGNYCDACVAKYPRIAEAVR